MIKYRKAEGVKYLSPWLFLIWVIIGVAIVAGVIIFYSAYVDVRAEEADILATKIVDCLVDNGYIKEDFNRLISGGAIKEASEVKSEFLKEVEKCGIDKNLIGDSQDFYFKVIISDFNSGKILIEIKAGNSDLEIQCGIKKEEEQFAECNEKKIYVLNKDNSKLVIKIFTGSNQFGEKQT